jgi:hypothetical protein
MIKKIYSSMDIYKFSATIKLYIKFMIISIINFCSKIKIRRTKTDIDNKVISTTIDINELNKKIEEIKSKYDEKELMIRNYEHQIKLLDAYNKRYDYKIKMMEVKTKIINDCLSIIKDVMKDIKTVEN